MSGTGSRAAREDIRVAIVDDLQLVVDGLTARLSDSKFGIRVVQSESSWAALVKNREFPPDVTVLDLSLGDGIPIDTKVHALTAAGSQVVIISRHADSAAIHRAMRSGALGFVPKSARATELVAAIHAAADGRRHSAVLSRPKQSTHSPQLGDREHRALVLYASGISIKAVALAMDATPETVKSYVKRARRKYRDAGTDLGTKYLLRRYALREGWLEDE